MITFTSSLPETTMQRLSDMAKKIKVPKNEIINRSLIKYLEAIERQMYIDSFKNLAGDTELLDMAEEGIEDYYMHLVDYEKK